MHILVLGGLSRYDVLSLASDEIAQAFRARGHDATLLSCDQMPPTQDFIDRLHARKDVDFVFSIFGIWGNKNRIDITAHTGAPLVLQYVDPPTSHFSDLQATRDSAALLFIDPTHIDDMAYHFAPGRFAHLGFCPHAALGKPQRVGRDADDFVARRTIPVFFAGTNYAPLHLPWIDFPENVRKLFTDVIDLVLSRDDLTVLAGTDAVLRARGVEPRDAAHAQLVTATRNFTPYICESVRIERRARLFDATTRIALPVVVCGQDYDDEFLRRHPNVSAMGILPVQDVLRMMGQSQMVLNASAIYPRGSHERPASAMVAGAVAVSDSTDFFRQAFVPGREIALYRWQHLDEDLTTVAELLEDPQRLFAIASAGQERAIKEHRWENRVDNYIEAGRIARARYDAAK